MCLRTGLATTVSMALLLLALQTRAPGQNPCSSPELPGKLYAGFNRNLVELDAATGQGRLVSDAGLYGYAGISGMEYDPQRNIIWAVDSVQDLLVRVDPATRYVWTVGAVGFDDVEGLALDPASNTLYGVDDATDQLIRIDRDTARGQAVGALGYDRVWGLAFDSRRRRLYGLTNASGNARLIRIDTSTGAGTLVGGSTSFTGGRGLAYNSAISTLYACASDGDTLYTINTQNGSSTAVGPIGWTYPNALAFDSSTSTLYGFDQDKWSLLTLNQSTGAGSIFNLTNLNQLDGAALEPGTSIMYSVDNTSKYLLGIDLAAERARVVAPLSITAVYALAFDPSADKLLGVDAGNLISIDRTTGAIQTIGPTGYSNVRSLVLTPDGNTLYACDANASRLLTINRTTGVATPVANTSIAMNGMAFNPAGDILYGVNTSGGLCIVNRATGQWKQLFSLPTLQDLVCKPDENALYAIGAAGTGPFRIDLATLQISSAAGAWDWIQGLAYDAKTRKLLGYAGSELLEINPATGRATLLLPYHYFSATGLAINADAGILYASNTSGTSVEVSKELTRQVLGTLSLSPNAVMGLAFDRNQNVLYGCDTTTDRLLRITTGGSITPVGPVTYGSVTGLEFIDGRNVLYGLDSATTDLLRIDPATGATTTIGKTGYRYAGGLAFVSDDCNGNGVPDSCETAEGLVPDCDSNGAPDTCQPDCDSDSVPNSCEIDPADPDGDGHVSPDCNRNGVPDECDLDCSTGSCVADCNSNHVPDSCEIDPSDPDGDGMVLKDCDANGVLDTCDLARGTRTDCDANGILDICDINPADPDSDGLVHSDCNGNHLPDECDIASGLSPDCNANGVIDRCEFETPGRPIFAWGANDYGQSTPPSGDEYVDIKGGNGFSIALRANGSLAAWGRNGVGQTDVPAGNDFTAIAAGYNHALALRADGSIVGWGSNTYGQLNAPWGDRFIAIGGSVSASYGLRADGSLVAWGGEANGNLNVPAGNDFVAFDVNYYSGLAIRKDGSIAGWGYNYYGNVTPPAGRNFVAVAVGPTHSIALKSDGSLITWGQRYIAVVEFKPSGNDFVEIDSGYDFGIARRADGTIAVWGSNTYGQASPPSVGLFKRVAAGMYHGLALRMIPSRQNDCNGNLIPDECELAGNDCDSNRRLDECDVNPTDPDSDGQVAPDCDANFRPDVCDFAAPNADCNGNGVLDACDLRYSVISPRMGPVQSWSGPISHTFLSPPPARKDVTFTVEAAGDLRYGSSYPRDLTVQVNGVTVGTVFAASGTGPSCGQPAQSRQLTMTASAFNAAVAGGNAVVTLTPNTYVLDCFSSYARVRMSYVHDAAVMDCNANSVPDVCEMTDCNANGVLDACDLNTADPDGDGQVAPDCNHNGVPDSCDIGEGASTDCNSNAVPDECELAETSFSTNSGTLYGIYYGAPKTFTVPAPPQAVGTVTLSFSVRGDLDLTSESVQVRLNGVTLGSIFVDGAHSCPTTPDTAQVTMTAAAFNAAVTATGSAIIECVPSSAVDYSSCTSSYIVMTLSYSTRIPDCDGSGTLDVCELAAHDCNANGSHDTCDIRSGISLDCNANNVPDECDVSDATSPDCNSNGVPDECDIAQGTSGDCNSSGIPDECEPDGDSDGKIDVCDNCPLVPNGTQTDVDSDTVGDVCDNCRTVPNTDQTDGDSDGIGNLCDNCPEAANADQRDRDSDGTGDVCDDDIDGDGTPNAQDACPLNPRKVADIDGDSDGLLDCNDNCPALPNPNQENICSPGPNILCVDRNAYGANDGTSWFNAYNKPEDALTRARNAGGAITEIWVAAGTYHPPAARSPYLLVSGVSLYGGFAGIESQRTQRDPAINVTILSGDLLDNDTGGWSDPSRSDNAYGLIMAPQGTPPGSSTISGFTLTSSGPSVQEKQPALNVSSWNATVEDCIFRRNVGGAVVAGRTFTADRCRFEDNTAVDGAAVYCYSQSSPLTLRDCTFSGNAATYSGGAVKAYYSSSFSIRSCSFSRNSAGYSGGAIEATGTVTAANCTFSQNTSGLPTSGEGGAVGLYGGSPRFVNCAFTGNRAGAAGGAMYPRSYCSLTLVNCLFSGNAVRSSGGALSGYGASVTALNCTFAANEADSGGGLGLTDFLTLSNCVFWGNVSRLSPGQQITASRYAPTISYCCIQGGWTGGTNITTLDPQFTRIPNRGPDGIWDGVNDDYGDLHFRPGSPSLDAGNNAAVPVDTLDIDSDGNVTEATPLDLDFHPRFQNTPQPDTGSGTPPLVDLGAYEAGGDCNGNGIPDTQEIDTDSDGWIDACDGCPAQPNPDQRDTDGDGVEDACDACAATVPGAAVDEAGCPPIIPGDFERDGDVDVTDLAVLERCASGSQVPHDGTPDCARADLDPDGDVDVDDFGIFQRCYSGSGSPADVNCAP